MFKSITRPSYIPISPILGSQDDARRQVSARASGQPDRRKQYHLIDVLAITLSLFCLAVGILAIRLKIFAWVLGFANQLVVIGFVLGIMSLCLQTTLPYALVLIETRYGSRSLLNYDAILTGKTLSLRTSWIWRFTILAFIALPLGLSVAYKKFLGGYASLTVKPLASAEYGLQHLSNNERLPFNDSIYFAVPALSSFRTAVEANNYSTRFSDLTNFPIPYGYNNLLLADGSMAALDVPTTGYISDLRSNLRPGESWNISSTVHAYTATLNRSLSAYRANDTYWKTLSQVQLWSFFLYDATVSSRLGMLVVPNSNDVWFGYYRDAKRFGGIVNDVWGNHEDAAKFRAKADMFTIKRIKCTGTWRVNRTTISTLLTGTCDTNSAPPDSHLNAAYAPAQPEDILSPLRYFFAWERYPRLDSQGWVRSVGAMSMVTAYWARGLEQVASDPHGDTEYTQMSRPLYPAENEEVISTRSTLRADPALFIVLSILPFIHLLAFAVTILLCDQPVSRGFGIVALLSGFDAKSQHLLTGAGHSGSLRTPLYLNISQEESPYEMDRGLRPYHDNTDMTLRYSVCRKEGRSSSVPRLNSRTLYW